MTTIKKQINIIYKALGLTIVAVLLINLIIFLIKLSQSNTMSVKFKHGLFVINGETSGLNYSETKYWLFYIGLFIISFFYFKRKNLIAK